MIEISKRINIILLVLAFLIPLISLQSLLIVTPLQSITEEGQTPNIQPESSATSDLLLTNPEDFTEEFKINDFGNHYQGEQSFDLDPIGILPEGWINSMGFGHKTLKSCFNGHDKVLYVNKAYNEITSVTHTFSASKYSGTVEWWAATDDVTNSYTMLYFRDDTNTILFNIGFGNGGNVYYTDGIGTYNIMAATNDVWYHFRVDFDCVTDTFDLYVNKEVAATDAPFRTAVALLQILNPQIGAHANVISGYWDAFDFSWSDGYYLNRNYNINYSQDLIDNWNAYQNFEPYNYNGQSSFHNGIDEGNPYGDWTLTANHASNVAEFTDTTIDGHSGLIYLDDNEAATYPHARFLLDSAITDRFTYFSWWHYPVTSNSYFFTRDSSNNLLVYLIYNGANFQYRDGTGYYTICTPAMGTWHHFLLIQDITNEEFFLYFDGTKYGPYNFFNSAWLNSQNVKTFDHYSMTTGTTYEGYLDAFSVCNYDESYFLNTEENSTVFPLDIDYDFDEIVPAENMRYVSRDTIKTYWYVCENYDTDYSFLKEIKRGIIPTTCNEVVGANNTIQIFEFTCGKMKIEHDDYNLLETNAKITFDLTLRVYGKVVDSDFQAFLNEFNINCDRKDLMYNFTGGGGGAMGLTSQTLEGLGIYQYETSIGAGPDVTMTEIDFRISGYTDELHMPRTSIEGLEYYIPTYWKFQFRINSDYFIETFLTSATEHPEFDLNMYSYFISNHWDFTNTKIYILQDKFNFTSEELNKTWIPADISNDRIHTYNYYYKLRVLDKETNVIIHEDIEFWNYLSTRNITLNDSYYCINNAQEPIQLRYEVNATYTYNWTIYPFEKFYLPHFMLLGNDYFIFDLNNNTLEADMISGNIVYNPPNLQVCYVSYIDQNGKNIDFDNLKLYINSTLFRENIFEYELGNNLSLEVTDYFGKSLLNHTHEVMRGINYIQLNFSMYNMQIYNDQIDFCYLNITCSGSNSSINQYISPGEFVNFELISENYSLQIQSYEDDSDSTYTIEIMSDTKFIINTTYNTVYFSVFNDFGFGLNNEIVRFYLNNERKSLGPNVVRGVTNVLVLDYFNQTLFNRNLNLSCYSEYNINVPVYTLIISNNYTDSMTYTITSDASASIEFIQVIGPQEAVPFQFLAEVEYHVEVSYMNGTSAEERDIILNKNNKAVSFGFYSKIIPATPEDLELTFENYLFFGLLSLIVIIIVVVLYFRARAKNGPDLNRAKKRSNRKTYRDESDLY